METAIRIKNLDVFAGKTQILKNINVEIPKNEITVILGPSGCGKTTLLKCMNRLTDLYPELKVSGEILRTVPIGLSEATYSLGSNKSELAFKIFTRQSVSGIITAVLLSFGRAIGAAASVLFTAGYTDTLPNSLMEPVATLPLSIFFQLASPVPEVQARAYASALVLTVIILIVSLFSRGLGKRYHKTKINF